MAQLIAPGTTESAWTDFEVDGTPAALFIKPATGSDQPPPAGVKFVLAHKTGDGDYIALVTLHAGNILDHGLVAGNGTYGVKRLASNESAGMDVEGAV